MTEERRLLILQILGHGEKNEAMIAMMLRECGHRVSHDQVRGDLAWLKEQGLVQIEDIATIQIATLTQRGLETATGIVTTPGVAKAKL